MARVLVIHGHRDAPSRPEISRECLRRVRTAERHARPGDVVVFSGAGVPGHLSEAWQMARAWRGPEIVRVLEGCSASTVENAVWTLEIVSRWLHVGELAVISSFWHIPRVKALWRGCGYPVRFISAPGSPRYLAGELRALARALLGARAILNPRPSAA